MNSEISAYILSGGESTRFKKDKTLYMFNEKPLISHVYDTIKPIFSDIAIISNDINKYKFLNIPIYADIIPNYGPLGGIYTALSYSKTDRAFIFAADMPFLISEFISYMIQLPDLYKVTVPFWNENFEPLHAIYSKKCLPYIENLIDNNEKKICSFFEETEIRNVVEDEIYFYSEDPFKMFTNINYEKDLIKQ